MIRIYSLRGEQNFNTVFRKGRRLENSFFRTHYFFNKLSHPRFAFVVPRTTSKLAVVRNRLRRRAREWSRLNLFSNLPPCDVVLVFKKDAVTISKKTFYEELRRAFGKIGS